MSFTPSPSLVPSGGWSLYWKRTNFGEHFSGMFLYIHTCRWCYFKGIHSPLSLKFVANEILIECNEYSSFNIIAWRPKFSLKNSQVNWERSLNHKSNVKYRVHLQFKQKFFTDCLAVPHKIYPIAMHSAMVTNTNITISCSFQILEI